MVKNFPVNTYAKNAVQVGQALGVVFAKQRKKREAQVLEVQGWIEQSSFPKKVRQGWPIKLVKEWWKHRPVARGAHGVTRPTSEEKQETEEERIERILSRLSTIEQKNVRKTLENYQIGETSAWEEKKLREIGLIGSTLADADLFGGGNGLGSRTALAEAIQKKYNFPCGKKDVSDWNIGRRIPDGAPSMPSPDTASGGFTSGRVEEAFAWFEKYIVEPERGGASQLGLIKNLSARAMQSKQQQEIDEGEMVSRELDAMRKASDKNFITWSQADGLMVDLGTLVNRHLNNAEKVVGPKLFLRPALASVGADKLPEETKLLILQELGAELAEWADRVKAEVMAHATAGNAAGKTGKDAGN